MTVHSCTAFPCPICSSLKGDWDALGRDWARTMRDIQRERDRMNHYWSRPFVPQVAPPEDEYDRERQRQRDREQMVRAVRDFQEMRRRPLQRGLSRLDTVLWSAFCLQWIAISWCAVVGREGP